MGSNNPLFAPIVSTNPNDSQINDEIEPSPHTSLPSAGRPNDFVAGNDDPLYTSIRADRRGTWPTEIDTITNDDKIQLSKESFVSINLLKRSKTITATSSFGSSQISANTLISEIQINKNISNPFPIITEKIIMDEEGNFNEIVIIDEQGNDYEEFQKEELESLHNAIITNYTFLNKYPMNKYPMNIEVEGEFENQNTFNINTNLNSQLPSDIECNNLKNFNTCVDVGCLTSIESLNPWIELWKQQKGEIKSKFNIDVESSLF
ncbi:uncharacterized protein I206_106163 [Kwoniella pini CBS 10737]|uniref:Uncharacterized protein n=1 Tax=Kwoniella pini CBS 10737 TaxID=1296096 RepID=A0A1B9I191_9TREE|nr:uncharacterized protein I206_04988 [Kwoniella pini CBS 10737]OCF49299.1 hypothetical protein I206_04988 [Kwoniella pini CBS 10737]